MVVLILPCNFTYKDAAAYTSLFNRVLPQDEYVVILLIFAWNWIVSERLSDVKVVIEVL